MTDAMSRVCSVVFWQTIANFFERVNRFFENFLIFSKNFFEPADKESYAFFPCFCGLSAAFQGMEKSLS